jgi:hypothetical protein
MHLRDLTIETAKPLEGTTFQITLADRRTTPITLDEVLPYELPTRRRARPGPAARTFRVPFSLYFHGDPAIVLAQGMYTLRGETETLEDVFIVPIGHDNQTTLYEAVFA